MAVLACCRTARASCAAATPDMRTDTKRKIRIFLNIIPPFETFERSVESQRYVGISRLRRESRSSSLDQVSCIPDRSPGTATIFQQAEELDSCELVEAAVRGGRPGGLEQRRQYDACRTGGLPGHPQGRRHRIHQRTQLARSRTRIRKESAGNAPSTLNL